VSIGVESHGGSIVEELLDKGTIGVTAVLHDEVNLVVAHSAVIGAEHDAERRTVVQSAHIVPARTAKRRGVTQKLKVGSAAIQTLFQLHLYRKRNNPPTTNAMNA